MHSGGNAWSPSAGDAEDAKEQQQHRHAESIDPRDLPRRVEVQEEEQEEETTPRRPSDVMSLAEAELRLEEGGGGRKGPAGETCDGTSQGRRSRRGANFRSLQYVFGGLQFSNLIINANAALILKGEGKVHFRHIKAASLIPNTSNYA